MKTTHSVSLHENKQNSAYQTLQILLIYQFICWKLPFGRRNLFSCFLPLVGNYSPVIRQLGEDFVANVRKWVGEQFQSCKEFANTLASAGFVKFYDAGDRRSITIERATKAFVETTGTTKILLSLAIAKPRVFTFGAVSAAVIVQVVVSIIAKS